MADGLLTQGLNYIDQQKQALAARLGLLMNNPQEFASQLGSEARQRAGVGLLGEPKTAQDMASGAWINSPYGQQAMQAASGFVGSIKPVKPAEGLLDYRGSHTAPSPEFGAPLYDLTGGGQMYPADVYSSKATQYYGTGFPKADQEAFALANSVRGNPNALVTMYRAVPKELSNSEKLASLEKNMAAYMKRKTLPKDAFTSDPNKWYDWAYEERQRLRQLPDEPINNINNINAGDWVTLSRDYAKEHGQSALKGNYKIISKKVKAKELWTNADSIHEFGYHPSK